MKLKTVLAIEDNPPLREMIRRRLERMSYAVQVAEDAIAGETLAREILPDIILLDRNLPGKNGWEVACALKQDRLTKYIPIIAVTAHAMLGDRENALRAGCDDYITKPIDFAELATKMHRLTGHDQGTRRVAI